ncbi:MAG: hypothetical protein WKG32_03690 [Gemmatimonadaceae bacterium]
MHRFVFALALSATAVAVPLAAQNRGRNDEGIPPGQRPPAGMCRIWIDDVPPGRQPAPTDCATAERRRPSNARVIYGANTQSARRDNYCDPRNTRTDPDCPYDDGRDRRDRRDDRADTRADRRGDNMCVDNNRDGVCDNAQVNGGVVPPSTSYPYPNTGNAGSVYPTYPRSGGSRPFPEMSSAALFARGTRTTEVVSWLGSGEIHVRNVDEDGNGVPEKTLWTAANNQPVQVWYDRDRNGRADRIEIWRGSQKVQTIE